MSAIAAGTSKDAIRMRNIVGVSITGTRSKTEFERQPLALIERQVSILLALEERLKTDAPTTDGELRNTIRMAVEDIDNPEHKSVSLLEAMLGQSVAAELGKKGPQPVAAILDKPTNGEAEAF
jgi:hypothetical protein